VYLGIDLGTSELKALILDPERGVVATAAEPLAINRPRPLWSEQHPDDWWTTLDRAMLRLHAAHPVALAAVRAIGPTGQMHGAVLLDRGDHVLRPAILWNDGRSEAECTQLAEAVPDLPAIAGNLAMPGFTAPKLLWVRTHEPGVHAATAKVLLPKDWLRLRLTGEHATDCSDASGTLWLDVARRSWSETLLDACGLDPSHMPRLVEGSEVTGRLRAPLAERWGLRPGVPVAGGGGDNAASAVGMGAVEAGQGFVSLGTSGVVFLASDRHRPRPEAAVHAFCHALPGRWHQMSVMLSATSALRWARTLLGLDSEAALVERAAALDAAQAADAPLFLPYLGGERTPHHDAHAQGVLFGLRHDHDAAAVAYAVVEGVTFGLLDGWQALEAPPGSVQSLALVGGGARSTFWGRLLASALGTRLEVAEGSAAAGALGAARLAWLAEGGDRAAACAAPAVARTFDPEPAMAARLRARHERFRALYPALAAEFRATPAVDAA
jgi:xylulokinase